VISTGVDQAIAALIGIDERHGRVSYSTTHPRRCASATILSVGHPRT
jgi:hypothetical protein